MTDIKYLQIRDSATNIPVMAIKLNPLFYLEQCIVKKAGFPIGEHFIILNRLGGHEAQYSPHDWGGRTMPVAHQELINNWAEYTSGDVVCVEYILGERDKPKAFE